MRPKRIKLIPITIFANRAVVTLLIQCFLFGAVYQSSIYYIPLYLLNARQFGILHAASIFTSSFILQSVVSTLGGLYISHFKRYGEVLWFGYVMWALGVGLCLTFDRSSSPGVIAGVLMVIGVGVGCVFQPTLVALQTHSPKSRRAVIISNRNFFRCCGGAVGLAVSAAVLQATVRSKPPAEFAYLADNTYALPSDLEPGPGVEAVDDAYMYASHAVFILQVPMMGACLLGCLLIKDVGLQPRDEESEKEPNPTNQQLISEPQDGDLALTAVAGETVKERR